MWCFYVYISSGRQRYEYDNKHEAKYSRISIKNRGKKVGVLFQY
jgi:hypothetical protein